MVTLIPSTTCMRTSQPYNKAIPYEQICVGGFDENVPWSSIPDNDCCIDAVRVFRAIGKHNQATGAPRESKSRDESRRQGQKTVG